MIRDVRSYRAVDHCQGSGLHSSQNGDREEFVGEEGRDLMDILKGFHWPF